MKRGFILIENKKLNYSNKKKVLRFKTQHLLSNIFEIY